MLAGVLVSAAWAAQLRLVDLDTEAVVEVPCRVWFVARGADVAASMSVKRGIAEVDLTDGRVQRVRVECEGYMPWGESAARLRDGVDGHGKSGAAGDGRVYRVRLTRTGQITGTVTDEAGNPMYGALVEALAPRRVAGQPGMARMAEVARTDDRGNYRLYDLAPGTYVVSALVQNEEGMRAAHAYYGNSSQLGRAAKVLVASGRTIAGIDIRMGEPSAPVGVMGRVMGIEAIGNDARVGIAVYEEGSMGFPLAITFRRHRGSLRLPVCRRGGWDSWHGDPLRGLRIPAPRSWRGHTPEWHPWMPLAVRRR